MFHYKQFIVKRLSGGFSLKLNLKYECNLKQSFVYKTNSPSSDTLLQLLQCWWLYTFVLNKLWSNTLTSGCYTFTAKFTVGSFIMLLEPQCLKTEAKLCTKY